MMPRLCLGGRWAAVVGCLTLIAPVTGARAAEGARRFDPGSFQILGVTLAKSEDADLARILGATRAIQGKHTDEAVRCYVSSGTDRTVLEFQDWLGTLVEFRVFPGSTQAVSRCAPTARVSSSLATGNGLKLGMSQSEVVALLGRPTKFGREAYVYESSYERPLTVEEDQRAKSSYRNPPQVMQVYEKIELKFKASKLVLVDVVRSETW